MGTIGHLFLIIQQAGLGSFRWWWQQDSVGVGGAGGERERERMQCLLRPILRTGITLLVTRLTG